MPISLPPLNVIKEFLGPVTRHTRRVEIYEKDGVTRWKKDKILRVKSGSVTVDYDRDERRSLDLTFDNTDKGLVNAPGEFWYDKILKVYRGVRLISEERQPGILIIVPTSSSRAGAHLRDALVSVGFGRTHVRAGIANLRHVEGYDILVNLNTASPLVNDLMVQSFERGVSIMTFGNGSVATWGQEFFGEESFDIPDKTFGELEDGGFTTVDEPEVRHQMAEGWSEFSYDFWNLTNYFLNPSGEGQGTLEQGMQQPLPGSSLSRSDEYFSDGAHSFRATKVASNSPKFGLIELPIWDSFPGFENVEPEIDPEAEPEEIEEDRSITISADLHAPDLLVTEGMTAQIVATGQSEEEGSPTHYTNLVENPRGRNNQLVTVAENLVTNPRGRAVVQPPLPTARQSLLSAVSKYNNSSVEWSTTTPSQSSVWIDPVTGVVQEWWTQADYSENLITNPRGRNTLGMVTVVENVATNPEVINLEGFHSGSAEADLEYINGAVRYNLLGALLAGINVGHMADTPLGQEYTLLIRARSNYNLNASMRIGRAVQGTVTLSPEWQWFRAIGEPTENTFRTGFTVSGSELPNTNTHIEIDRVLIAPSTYYGSWFSGNQGNGDPDLTPEWEDEQHNSASYMRAPYPVGWSTAGSTVAYYSQSRDSVAIRLVYTVGTGWSTLTGFPQPPSTVGPATYLTEIVDSTADVTVCIGAQGSGELWGAASLIPKGGGTLRWVRAQGINTGGNIRPIRFISVEDAVDAVGQTLYFRAFLGDLEYSGAYGDGDVRGWTWSGEAHNSASTQAPRTAEWRVLDAPDVVNAGEVYSRSAADQAQFGWEGEGVRYNRDHDAIFIPAGAQATPPVQGLSGSGTLILVDTETGTETSSSTSSSVSIPASDKDRYLRVGVVAGSYSGAYFDGYEWEGREQFFTSWAGGEGQSISVLSRYGVSVLAENLVTNPRGRTTDGVVTIAENLVSNPRGRTTSGTVTIAENLLSQPRLELDGLIAGGDVLPLIEYDVTPPEPIFDGGNVTRVLYPEGQSGHGGSRASTRSVQVFRGDAFWYSIWVYQFPPGFQLHVTGSQGLGSMHMTEGDMDGWSRWEVSNPFTVQNQGTISIRGYFSTAPTTPQSVLLGRACVSINPISYFDGDTTYDPDFIPEWTGEAHNSPSRLTAPRPVGVTATNGIAYYSSTRDAVALRAGEASGNIFVTHSSSNPPQAPGMLTEVWSDNQDFNASAYFVSQSTASQVVTGGHGILRNSGSRTGTLVALRVTNNSKVTPGDTFYYRTMATSEEYAGLYGDPDVPSWNDDPDLTAEWSGVPHNSPSRLVAPAPSGWSGEGIYRSESRDAVMIPADAEALPPSEGAGTLVVSMLNEATGDFEVGYRGEYEGLVPAADWDRYVRVGVMAESSVWT